MSAPDKDLLPVVRAADLETASEQQPPWLVQSLLPRSGVSICGGAPKCCKSWMGLDLALSVASGTPCLDRFAVARPGPALIYLAEDPPAILCDRLAGICRHRGLDLAAVPLEVITAPILRLDLERDQQRLERTVRHLRPRLLLLDPFVRLHRLRENDAGDVSALLGYLRALQREHDLAVLVVHHARKSGAAGTQTGHGLRGSGDFYAFVDSLLYLRRQHEQLVLSVEHRAAPAPPELGLALVGTVNPHLGLLDGAAQPCPARPGPSPFDAKVLRAIDQGGAPLSRAALRAALHCSNQLLDESLSRLTEAGLLEPHGENWARAPRPPTPISAARASAEPPLESTAAPAVRKVG